MGIVQHVLPPAEGRTKWFTDMNPFEAQETRRQIAFKNRRWPGLPDGTRKFGGDLHSYPHILPDDGQQVGKALFDAIANEAVTHFRKYRISFHKEALNLRSSQVSCLNVMFPLHLDRPMAAQALIDVLPGVTEVTEIDFEYTGPDGTTAWLGEPKAGGRGRMRTSIDVAIWWRRGKDRALALCEWKYTESTYGPCGGYDSDSNPNKEHCCSELSAPAYYVDDCYLRTKREPPHYWSLLDEAGIDLSAAHDGKCCPLKGAFYQLMRQYLVAHYERLQDPELDVRVVALSFGGNKSLHEASTDGTTVEERWNRCLQKPEQALRTIHVESIINRARGAAGEQHQPWLDYLNERYGL